MVNNYISLKELTKLIDHINISKNYINYIAFKDNKYKYRHEEILSINQLISNHHFSNIECNDFIYSYTLPHLNKEFDLIKFMNNKIVNIELKSKMVSLNKIKKQLMQNKYYLRIFNKPIYLFTYVYENDTLFTLKDNSLIKCEFNILKSLIHEKGLHLNLDEEFKPSQILISPLNNIKGFINNDYLLTQQQSDIKEDILISLQETNNNQISIKGEPGTGKTLLLYDLAKNLTKNYKILIIHSNELINDYRELEKALFFKICDIRSLNNINLEEYEIILIDECQFIDNKILSNIISLNKKLIIIYDDSLPNLNLDTLKLLNSFKIKYKLTTRMRINKEINLFIKYLFSIPKNNIKKIYLDKIKIIYIKDSKELIEKINYYQNKHYQYIYLDNHENNNIGKYYLNVIGQEFDNVILSLDSTFFYENNHLYNLENDLNPLYIALTRTRNSLVLLIKDISLLDHILKLF